MIPQLLFALAMSTPTPLDEKPDALDEKVAARFARLALECVHREYPNKIAHAMSRDEDAKPPRELTPAFYGCYDWHSAVHGHWLLARLARTFPAADFASRARAALDRSLTESNITVELDYIRGDGRGTFERPYGLAWLLQLAAELHEWSDPDAQRWAAVLEPLELEVVRRFESWLPKLTYPIRTGEHSQTAFAFGLVFDYAVSRGNASLKDLIATRSIDYYGQDRDAPLHFEPSGQDFLSPTLAEADLMRRLLDPDKFRDWLGRFLPNFEAAGPMMEPATVTDRSDGKLAHLDGLHLSRAWMLDGIASALDPADARYAIVIRARDQNREAGLAAVTGAHYEAGHWLGSFAVYLTTRRGL